MDIEQIEKILSGMIAELDKQPEEDIKETFFEVSLPLIQCQLLLHIYRKLEAIEEQGQTEPGKWK